MFIIYYWTLSDFSYDDGYTALWGPRQFDPKNGVKNYQGPTTYRENSIRKYIPKK
jgi:hypothetical protein